MSTIDIISSNNALSHLNQVKRKKQLFDYIIEDDIDEPDISPAYIVELSNKGKQLLQDHPSTIVHL